MARRSYGSGSLYLRADGNGAETWFAVWGEQDPPASVLVVAIDDVTLGALQQRFPFSRRLHARLLDRLRQEGARAIGYEVQFTEPTNPADDTRADGIDPVCRGRHEAMPGDP